MEPIIYLSRWVNGSLHHPAAKPHRKSLRLKVMLEGVAELCWYATNRLWVSMAREVCRASRPDQGRKWGAITSRRRLR